MWKYILYIAFLGFCALASTMELHAERRDMTIEYHFRYDDPRLVSSFRNNKNAHLVLISMVDSVGMEKIDSIVINTASSPEGTYRYNERLTRGRARSIYRYLCGLHPKLKDKLVMSSKVEAWDELRELVSKDTVLTGEQRERTLEIIDSDMPLSKKKRMMAVLPFYKYLKEAHYTRIRKSMVRIYQTIPEKPEEKFPPMKHVTEKVGRKAEILPMPALAEQETEAPRKTILAVKTNMLYDAMTAVNFAIEVPIGKKWSVEVEDVCPWWHNGNKRAFQMLQVSGEGRYWFHRTDKRNVLTGHYGGTYAMGGKYDLQNRKSVCYQGEFWSVGVSYGYAMPLGKHFNMEFALSLGLVQTNYRHYTPSADYDELVADPYKRGKFSYIGPTKLKVSIVYPFTIKYKKRKGGLNE